MKTQKRTQPSELKKYIAVNYNNGISHYNHSFKLREKTEKEIFYLFAFCLMVPGGNAKRTNVALELLMKEKYFDRNITSQKLLSLIKPYVRFPQQKAERLIEFKLLFPALYTFLVYSKAQKMSGAELREHLVEQVRGLGYKASSHVLRNLGYTDMAIIDTHILKYAQYFVPSCKGEMKYPGSKKQYLYVESCFRHWSQTRFKLDPTVLDWFIWCKESGNAVDALDR